MASPSIDLTKAALSLVDYGRRLAAQGLVARTWGNLSIRVGDHMVITPSGIAYEDLDSDSMVAVSLGDLTWTGSVKPSSEKDLHGAIYRLHKSVGAIFHTHQNYASALAATRKSFPVEEPEQQKLLGPVVACADYALPTTKTLARSVAKLLATELYPAILLANHGTICLGEDPARALEVALALEDFSKARILTALQRHTGLALNSEEALAEAFVGGRIEQAGGRRHD